MDQLKRLLIAALIMGCVSFAHAEIVIYELGSTAANTLNSISRNFVVGFAILAAGIVVAAFISKKK